MNKAGLQKLVGHHVKLDPAAVAITGKLLDDDWTITQVAAAVELRNEPSSAVAVLGHDAVYCFWTDPVRSTDTEIFGT